MLQFTEGTCVAIKNDNPALSLTVGDKGTIWALYDTEPPSYEVTFSPTDGEEFDALMYEEELMEVTDEWKIGSPHPNRSLASAA